MCIRMDKSGFLFNNVEVDTLDIISSSFPYKCDHITQGFKYLGYYIKPLGYMVKDLYWQLKKFERRI